jgi:hypothetical protein
MPEVKIGPRPIPCLMPSCFLERPETSLIARGSAEDMDDDMTIVTIHLKRRLKRCRRPYPEKGLPSLETVCDHGRLADKVQGLSIARETSLLRH